MGMLGKTWNDVKGNVKYDIIKYLIFGLGATATSALYRWIQHVFHLAANTGWVYVLLAILLFNAFLLCAIASNLSRRDRPRLVLSLGNMVWQYRKDDNMTAFFVLASLINKGEPSVAWNWRIRYRVGDSEEPGELYNIAGSYALNVGDTKITFTNDDLLNLKTLETPIQRGQFVGGRLFFAVPGDRTAQIQSIQQSFEVECQDYLGNVSTAMYKPSPLPPKSLLGHYKEKREFIDQEEENSAKQPVSVSYAQESPSLGDGS